MLDPVKNTNKLTQTKRVRLTPNQHRHRLEVIKTLLRDDNINPKQCYEAINKLVNTK